MNSKNSGGFTVIEVLVASVIISVSLYGIVSGYTQFLGLVGQISNEKASYFSIANIRESIMASPEHYQFAPSETLGTELLEDGKLPWFATNQQLVAKTDCQASKSCDQYVFSVGYVLYPHPSGLARSLYTLHIRVVDKKQKTTNDFKYLVAIK